MFGGEVLELEFKGEKLSVNLIDEGQGDVIVFLHGWGGNKNSFASTLNLLKNKNYDEILKEIDKNQIFQAICKIKNIDYNEIIGDLIIRIQDSEIEL